METIAIDPNEALEEEATGKKKIKVSNTAKAAMATGVAGIAAGVAAKSVMDAPDDETDKDGGQPIKIQDSHQEATHTINESQEEAAVVTSVNPAEVMLEEHVNAPSSEVETESDATQEVDSRNGEGPVYQPFANNDRISDEIIPEPQPDEILIGENTGLDVVAEGYNTVDLICGLSEEDVIIPGNPVCPEETLYPEDLLCADNGQSHDSGDIQSSLMA